MSDTTATRFLVIAPDPSLEEEFDIALEGVKGKRCVVSYERDTRSAIETARLRQPDIVVVEMGARVAELKAFAEEIAAVAPDAAVVAVYRRETLADPEAESSLIIEALRARVMDFLRRPLSSSEVANVIARLQRGDARRGGGALGKVISFVSNKGGVGKSSVSVNVACELARRHPGEVILLDLSLQLGVAASMLDLDVTQSMADAAEQLDRLDITLLQQLALPHESGLRVLPAPPTVLAASAVDDRVVSRVIALARRAYKYVVIDTFPVVDGVVMSVLDLSNIVCVVTQVIVPILNGTSSLLETLEQLGIDEDRTWIILNRAQKSFPGQLTPADVEAHLNRAVRHEVAFDKKLPMATNMGRPHVLQAGPWNRFRRSIGRIVDDIETATLATASGRGDVGGDDDEGDQAPPARRLRAVGGDL
ncbi:MAG: CpaE family protein [Planctomycetota bacterium]